MIIIEALARRIAEKIATQLDYDDDKRAVIAYGLVAILQMTTIFLLITIIGTLFNFWFESLIVYLGVGFIRKSTGGAHSKTMNGCIIISVLSITVLSAMSRYILNFKLINWVNICVSIFVFVVCLIVFYIRVPVDNPNKPIVNPSKIRRLRKQSYIKLVLFFIILIALVPLSSSYNRFYSIAMSVRLTMLWQLFTLTKIGIYILDKIDSKINWIMVKDKF